MFQFLTKRNRSSTYIIGVMGLSKGVGTTHIALLLAGFVRSYYGRKTIFLEASGNHDLCLAFDVEDKKKSFTRYGVTYLLEAKKEDIAQTRNTGYDFCVIDLGSKSSFAQAELIRCDIKIIIGGGAPWQQKMWSIAEELKKEVMDCSSFHFLINFGDISDKIKRNLSPATTHLMPFEPNLYRISDITVHLFYELFKTTS